MSEQADMPDVPRALIRYLGRGVLVGLLCIGVSCSGPRRDDSGAKERSRVYHVQVAMTKEKPKADETLGRALSWWRTHADTIDARPVSGSGESPVKIVWKAPLYRVRLGPFATAKQAQAVLSTLRSTFPDAFVAPGRPVRER